MPPDLCIIRSEPNSWRDDMRTFSAWKIDHHSARFRVGADAKVLRPRNSRNVVSKSRTTDMEVLQLEHIVL